MKLIIVSGPPCSGKTTLARRLADHLALPLICRDDIKEALFDTVGWRDRAWSQHLGRMSYDILYAMIERLARQQLSLIAESNFEAAMSTPRINDIVARYQPLVIHARLAVDPSVLLQRFHHRWNSGQRHPGHIDDQVHMSAQDIPTILSKHRLDLGGHVADIDTTEITEDDIQRLAKWMNSARPFPL